MVQNGCRRLGKKGSGDLRPRKLLVQLTSSTNAADLIADAKRLKHNNDQLAQSVHINRDLTPTEARLAYERRQRRRQQKMIATDTLAPRNCPDNQVASVDDAVSLASSASQPADASNHSIAVVSGSADNAASDGTTMPVFC